MEVTAEMHVSLLDSIVRKGGNRFYTFKELAEATKEATWAKFDLITPALETMIRRGQLEHDPVCGYCPKGQKEFLKREMQKPRMGRAEFDKLDCAAQGEFCRNGGIVV